MNQKEALTMVCTDLPEVSAAVTKKGAAGNPFALIRILTQHLNALVAEHNESRIEKCLQLVNKLYIKGDLVLKNAVENVFIFSLDQVLGARATGRRSPGFSKVPADLYTCYLQQIYKSGI